MKKHVFLTSLFAIGLSCGAHAATDFATDLTFGGKYNDGKADVTKYTSGATYDYTKTDGSLVSGVDSEIAPDKSDFTYIASDGTSSSLADLTEDNMPKIEDYLGETAATEDSGVVKSDDQQIVAGATAERKNYTYKIGDTDVVLGDKAPDVTETVKLGDEVEVTVTNGEVQFDNARYTVEINGKKFQYNRSEDGGYLVDADGNIANPAPNSEMAEKLAAVEQKYNADRDAVKEAITSTKEAYENGKVAFEAAEKIFEADEDKIKTLTDNYNSIADAQKAFAAAEAAQAAAQASKGENDELFAAADKLYNAPILETINNGANDAIDASLADGGAINTALAEKASVEDVKTNTANIAANATAIADNKTAIETNAENIAANKKAIADEAAERKAADEQLAHDIKAGDEMTLAAAKQYVEDYNAVALQAANSYTDKKVKSLEKELSAGIASTAAMSSIEVSNVSKGEVSVGGGYGYYNSQSAVAFGAAMGLTDNWSVNAAAGLADSNVSFRAGTNYKFKLFK